MSNKTFLDLPAAASLTGVEVLAGVQSGISVKFTAQDVADLAAGGGTSFGDNWNWQTSTSSLVFTSSTLLTNWLTVDDNGAIVDVTISCSGISLTSNSAEGINLTNVAGPGVSLSLNELGDIDINAGRNIDLDLVGQMAVNGDSGTASQVLTSNGPNVPPTWENSGGGGGIAIARARILADGTIDIGSHIASVDHAATGTYIVTYEAEFFSFAPVVGLTFEGIVGGGLPLISVFVQNNTGSEISVVVNCKDVDGVFHDSNFHITAIASI